MEVNNLILKLINNWNSPEFLNDVNEYKTSRKIPDSVKGKKHYQDK